MYTLNWQPPYDWSWMFGFLAARAVTGVETVTKDYYERSFGYAGHRGVFRVTPDSATPTLAVSLSPGLIPVADICLDRIARLFDLDCDPQHIAQTLGDLGAARPGLRLPGAMDAYEQGVRAILGQLVSVAMAAKLASRVVALCGEPIQDAPGYLCFPPPEVLAAVDPLALKALGMPLRRYVLATLLGIVPASIVYASVGAGLGAVLKRGEQPDLGIIFLTVWVVLRGTGY